ncbi:MAG TPA: flagellar basal body L-ring protein FlgH [Candidatus Hydrogenedentes bacterium]|nr:flagellar basal body L-ring protein FlgH [Candidatus Hydrogenedentota bacterium]
MRGKLLIAAGMMLAGTAGADSLFQLESTQSGTLIAERRNRFEPGDVITVLVNERIDASTTSDTNVKKESDVEAKTPAAQNKFFVSNDGLNILNPDELPNWNIEVENETKARGRTVRRSTLNTAVSCLVKQVYPNGNMLIEGEKTLSVNREDSSIALSGIVRSRDVTPANTVTSSQVANMQLKLRGKGPLWNNQRRGLFTRLLDWISPF